MPGFNAECPIMPGTYGYIVEASNVHGYGVAVVAVDSMVEAVTALGDWSRRGLHVAIQGVTHDRGKYNISPVFFTAYVLTRLRAEGAID